MKNYSARYIAFQILIWGVGWLLILLALSNENKLDTSFWHRAIITVMGASIVVFINLRWLLPNLYFSRKRVLYFLSASLMLMTIVWGMHSDHLPWNQLNKKGGHQFEEKEGYKKVGNDLRWLIRSMPPLFISLLGSSLISVSIFAREKREEAMWLEKSKLETEIKFLKSQINPHFLFNSLHNIYALTVIQSDQASEQLLKLSDILRYMLYDSNEERVPLWREVEYLQSYLGLAQLKDSRGMDIRFDLDCDDKNITVVPLLFIPFVENAFKHSQIEDLQNGYIHLSLNTWGNGLVFNINNSKSQKEYNKDKVGGIGLNNIRQRLALLYPEKHNLSIEETETTFKVHLELDCL